MPLQTLPPSADRYGRTQRAEFGAAQAAVQRLWRRMGDDFDASWLRVAPQLLAVLDEAQATVSRQALAFVPAVLAETGQLVRDLEYEISPVSMVGTAGNGLPTDSMAYGAVTRSRTAIAAGATVDEALAQGGRWLNMAASTLLSDTARTMEQMASHARRVGGYVRMLEPPSCGRCAVMAGKWFRTNAGFQRHPRCDCRHIPASESVAGDLTVDPKAYLSSMSDDELIEALGSRANAAAFRDGADPGRIVNAYRGGNSLRTAQVYDRRVKYTVTGRTSRSQAFQSLSSLGTHQELAGTAVRVTRTGPEMRVITRTVATAPRLMPESIYRIAADRREAVALLRQYGWI